MHAEDPTYTLKGTSVTFFTTDYQEKAAPVAAQNVIAADSKLTRDPVSAPNYCYYRVFAEGVQIASTVACALPVEDAPLCYKVLSVDRWGNV